MEGNEWIRQTLRRLVFGEQKTQDKNHFLQALRNVGHAICCLYFLFGVFQLVKILKCHLSIPEPLVTKWIIASKTKVLLTSTYEQVTCIGCWMRKSLSFKSTTSFFLIGYPITYSWLGCLDCVRFEYFGVRILHFQVSGPCTCPPLKNWSIHPKFIYMYQLVPCAEN